MFLLQSIIKIGIYTFYGGVNELVIKKSVHTVMQTGTLKIPAMGRVVSKSNTKNLPLSSVATAKLFKEGDPVNIQLGYNGDLRSEFVGFVRRVNIATPLSVDLEGYGWQLRNQPSINKTWPAVTLKDLLYLVIAGTDIVLSPDIPVVNLTNLHFKNVAKLDVLDYLKEKLLLTVYFDDNMLYAGIEEGATTVDSSGNRTLTGLAQVTHSIGYNTIKDDQLKQRLETDTKIRVRLKTAGNDGIHVLYEAGDVDGDRIDRIVSFTKDANFLKRKAAAFLKELKYNGYEGKIKGFLQPYCKPGWKDNLLDTQYAGSRAGVYFIPATEVTFGVDGARRTTEISYKLDG